MNPSPRRPLALTILAAFAFSMLRVAIAHADDLQTDARDAKSVTSCAIEIKTCGCTITKPGTYTVTANLTAAQGLNPNGDCLDVKAPNVILLLNGFPITGTGSGTGLHLLSSANNALVEGVRGKNSTATASGTKITGWEVGMEIDSANGTIEDFQTNSNNQAGVFLNKARNNNVNDFTAMLNTVYGVWAKASSGNQINCGGAFSNGNTGVYLGCSASGPSGQKCKGVGPSTKNKIYDLFAGGKTDPNTVAGVALDLGSTSNFVADVSATANGTDDLIDENLDCDHNQWYAGGNWGTANQKCIQ